MKNYVIHATDMGCRDIISIDVRKEMQECKHLLIQCFFGQEIEDAIKIVTYLQEEFAHANIISTSTDGEIENAQVLTNHSIISISLFDATEIACAYVNEGDSFANGRAIAKQLIKEDTKLLLCFANGLACNGDAFLEGVASVNESVKVAGGLSGDNAKFTKCFQGIGGDLYTKGVVAAVLNSKVLKVESLFRFGWKPIGQQHKVTKAEKNRVYMIDNLTAVEFYAKYLGEGLIKHLPANGIEFPLIIKDEKFYKARAVIQLYNDGSLGFAGDVPQGSKIYIGIGDTSAILHSFQYSIDMKVEAFFIYSCMARRRFLPEKIYMELVPFSKVAPTSGFFTYGEFFSDKKYQLLNQTLTAVALSENFFDETTIVKEKHSSEVEKSKEGLINILSEITKEIKTKEQKLKSEQKILQQISETLHIGRYEVEYKTGIIQWSKESYINYGLNEQTAPQTVEEYLKYVHEEDKRLFLDVFEMLKDGEVHSVTIRYKKADEKYSYILHYGQLIFNENGEPSKIIGLSQDITEIKLKDSLLVQQAKHAQMGEMVSMIAHQWRQPINAVSAASIKLNLQGAMGSVTKEDIEETMQFIQQQTQKMSQTIDDFMNFTKPVEEKIKFSIKEIVEDIMNLMGVQLQNHNIFVDTEKIDDTLEIVTYKKELEHVLLNIISNAKDALISSQKTLKKWIMIGTQESDETVEIYVQDNAGGIPSTIIDRIFEPYFTTKAQGKGTGIGLYMSKKLVEEHLHGQLVAQNIDDGAKFRIILNKSEVLDD